MSSREKILQCAGELFTYHGYHATSVDDILRQSGVARSNFYYHFRTKDELVLAVMDRLSARYETMIAQSLRNADLRPAERLDRFYAELSKAQAGEWRAVGCPLCNMAASLSPVGEDTRSERYREWLCSFFQQMEDALTECVDEGIRRGEFRSDVAAQDAAALMLAATQGLLMLAKTRRETGALPAGFSAMALLLSVR